VDEEVPAYFPFFLGWSVAVGVVVVGVVHLTAWWAVSAGSVAFQVVGVGIGMTLAALSLVLLGWVYWRIHLDPEDRRPYLVAILASAATVGVCTAAFAALTTLLIRHGVIDTVQGETPELTEVEALYLWHLVDAVPILGVTGALHWEPPVTLSDPSGGALLLVFKVLLLIPLVRVLLAGFRLVLATLVSLGSRSPKLPLPRRRTGLEVAEQPVTNPALKALLLALGLAGILLWTAAAFAVLELVVRRSSIVDDWVDGHVPGTVQGFGLLVSTSWLPLALDVAGAWVVIAMAWAIADESMDIDVFVREHSRGSTAGVAGLVLWLFGLSVLGATAVTLTLLHAGLAETTTQLSGTNEVGATLEWFSWHLVDAIPVLDVTNTLGWTIQVEYVDPWTGVVLVVMRAVMVGILLVPFVVVSRLLLAQAARRLPRSPQVDAARDFSRQVGEVQAALDGSDAQLRREVDATFPDHGPTYYEARRLLVRVDRALDPVAALLGEGPAHEAGKRVVAALNARADALASARTNLFHAGGRQERVHAALAGLEVARAEAETERAAYQALVAEALAGACDATADPLADPNG
jgi:hypothetical protein